MENIPWKSMEFHEVFHTGTALIKIFKEGDIALCGIAVSDNF